MSKVRVTLTEQPTAHPDYRWLALVFAPGQKEARFATSGRAREETQARLRELVRLSLEQVTACWDAVMSYNPANRWSR